MIPLGLLRTFRARLVCAIVGHDIPLGSLVRSPTSTRGECRRCRRVYVVWLRLS